MGIRVAGLGQKDVGDTHAGGTSLFVKGAGQREGKAGRQKKGAAGWGRPWRGESIAEVRAACLRQLAGTLYQRGNRQNA